MCHQVNLENGTLDAAVAALKGAPRGDVRILVAKPLPLPEIGESSTDDVVSTLRAYFLGAGSRQSAISVIRTRWRQSVDGSVLLGEPSLCGHM